MLNLLTVFPLETLQVLEQTEFMPGSGTEKSRTSSCILAKYDSLACQNFEDSTFHLLARVAPR